MTRSTLWTITLATGLASCAAPALESEQEKFYVYQNCGDQMIGPPLTRCSQVRISYDLADVYRNDIFDVGIKAATASGFRAVNSFLAPIAIPDDYGRTGAWIYGKYKYVKVGSANAALFSNEPVDTIVVVGNLDKIKDLATVDSLHSLDLLDNQVASFWYSARKGVLAIGYSQLGDSGEVFYCVSNPCLFAQAASGSGARLGKAGSAPSSANP